ncbi:hypothetical protein VP01_2054g2 [Puccinia sorghi]|uniref:Uncharacterized protein n=1 Tax=Puccinia sorghi TaxID=27349 RepID=A0A0L6VAY8_9BASI|nr:hypothetical protein VP01_2054g2 [Puccinia sorghi]
MLHVNCRQLRNYVLQCRSKYDSVIKFWLVTTHSSAHIFQSSSCDQSQLTVQFTDLSHHVLTNQTLLPSLIRSHGSNSHQHNNLNPFYTSKHSSKFTIKDSESSSHSKRSQFLLQKQSSQIHPYWCVSQSGIPLKSFHNFKTVSLAIHKATLHKNNKLSSLLQISSSSSNSSIFDFHHYTLFQFKSCLILEVCLDSSYLHFVYANRSIERYNSSTLPTTTSLPHTPLPTLFHTPLPCTHQAKKKGNIKAMCAHCLQFGSVDSCHHLFAPAAFPNSASPVSALILRPLASQCSGTLKLLRPVQFAPKVTFVCQMESLWAMWPLQGLAAAATESVRITFDFFSENTMVQLHAQDESQQRVIYPVGLIITSRHMKYRRQHIKYSNHADGNNLFILTIKTKICLIWLEEDPSPEIKKVTMIMDQFTEWTGCTYIIYLNCCK